MVFYISEGYSRKDDSTLTVRDMIQRSCRWGGRGRHLVPIVWVALRQGRQAHQASAVDRHSAKSHAGRRPFG